MGHGCTNYYPREMKRLEGIGQTRGLDKIGSPSRQGKTLPPAAGN